jgi:hypothetical protein
MLKLTFPVLCLISASLFPLGLSAHSSHDPIKDLSKYESSLKEYQDSYDNLEQEQKVDNLKSQISILEKKLFTLRDVLARDYPHVKSSMSKYKLDYMDNIDDTLQELKTMVGQAKSLTE